MFQRTSAFLFLLIIFIVFSIPACSDEDFAPAVDDLDGVVLDVAEDIQNEKDTIDDKETTKEIPNDLCGQHNELPMNCCLDGENGCKLVECKFVTIDGQCVLSCDQTIIFYSVGTMIDWSGVPEDFSFWGFPEPPPFGGPLPEPPPNPNNPPPPIPVPIFCQPWK